MGVVSEEATEKMTSENSPAWARERATVRAMARVVPTSQQAVAMAAALMSRRAAAPRTMVSQSAARTERSMPMPSAVKKTAMKRSRRCADL